MPEVVQVTPEVAIPVEELEFRTSRSSGPGGQSFNTSDSRVELRFDLEGSPSIPPEVKERARRRLASRLDRTGHLRLVAQSQRSQLANRRDATARFAAMLADALAAPRTRRATRPGPAAVRRRVEEKRRRAQTKQLRRRPPSESGD